MRESTLEETFKRRVISTGGRVRKLRWLDRVGGPDRFVFWPVPSGGMPVCAFVELKRPGGTVQPEQNRELNRLAAAGFETAVIDSLLGIELFLGEMLRRLEARRS